MGYLKHVRTKLQYDPLPQVIIDGLSKTGLKIKPYYLMAEGLFGETIPHLEEGFPEFGLTYLGRDAMKLLASIPYRVFTEDQLLLRLEQGEKCYAAVHHNDIAAFTWYGTDRCHFWPHSFPLKSNEAYLFDAFTLNRYRGKSIAPYLRYQLYKELARQGRTELYSISERFNASSIKFKKKLKARILGRGIGVEIFGRWRMASPLRHL